MVSLTEAVTTKDFGQNLGEGQPMLRWDVYISEDGDHDLYLGEHFYPVNGAG